MKTKEDKETKLFKAFQNGVREGKLEQKKENIENIKRIIYGEIDWIEVFKEAYEGRKTSWVELGHIREWRNATDEVLFAVWHQLEKQLQKEISSEEGK